MRVFVTGGTGLIGKALVGRLLERGDQPVVLSRHADKARRDPSARTVQFIQGDPSVSGAWDSAVDGCDAVINLVGHNLFADRWNPEVRRKIRDSRVYSTEHVVAAIARAQTKPKVLVQASAIGYYGPHGDEELTESSPSGADFMAVVCREWEEAAAPAEALGVRLATIRTGVVLAKGEGALGVLTPIFKWLPGGASPVGGGGAPHAAGATTPFFSWSHVSELVKPGAGNQWMSWIHVDDIVGIMLLALDNDSARGPINGTAPNPVRNKEFSKALATVLGRRFAFVPFGPPDAVLEVVLGEVAQVITKGQKVIPLMARQLGYKFRHPDILPALRAIYAKAPAPPRPSPAPRAATASAGHHH